METHDFEKRARRAYEWGRARFAAFWVVGVLALGLGVLGVSHRPAAVGSLSLGLAAILGWTALRGMAVFAGARAGLLGGLVPLGLALAMRNLGECYAMDGYCVSWCVAGCALGGAAAAFLILQIAGGWRTSPTYWGMATLTLLATGSLSCGCAGIMGVAALGVGFAVGMAPVGRLVLVPADQPVR